ncbi:conserved hypothetical protein [Ferroglobus placidus DSM 10642]|uniref:HNH domain-containing protein n=1 Tax=Ferroglobus placidus (strain DSM 10642 / AEDII12DO) TaxID=589924 RepID=D3S3A4_FERPA|nr:HNH endonuclease [Ferroglobus placidus]ADC64737.1 conserved hypothetical protein [Ferroglobus placidus DSM 10642]
MRRPVCELCGIPGDLTRHHIVPNPVRRRLKRKKGKSAEEVNSTVLLCRDCHRQLHALFTEKELACMTWDEIKSKESVRKWVDWIRKKRGQKR